MSPTVTTFLFQTFNFLMLAGLLGWLFFNPVRDSIQRRRDALKRQADDASKQLADAERLRSEMENQRAELENELERQREQSKSSAEKQAELIISDAREAARRETETAKSRVKHLERSKLEYLARVIAETTGSTIDRLLIQLDQPDLDHGLTAAACHQIRQFDGNSLSPVRIESARPLAPSDRDALKLALRAAAESAEFHVDEDLGMGLRVSTNRGLVDVSAKGLSTYARLQLCNQLTSKCSSAVEAENDG